MCHYHVIEINVNAFDSPKQALHGLLTVQTTIVQSRRHGVKLVNLAIHSVCLQT